MIVAIGADHGGFHLKNKIGLELAKEIVRVWLSASFSGNERHKRRLSKIEKIEKGFLVK